MKNLTFSFLILFIVLLLFSCKKNDTVKNAIKDNELNDTWCMSFMDDGHLYLDSIVLSNQGFECNISISEEGSITVYDGTTQDKKVAEWEITEISGTFIQEDLNFTLMMTWPDKYKNTYQYLVTNHPYSNAEYVKLCVFTPVKNENKFVFFNNKNLGSGLIGSYCFRRS